MLLDAIDSRPSLARFFNDATPDYLQVDASPVTAPPFTAAGWFNCNSETNVGGLFFTGDLDVTADHFYVMVRGTTAGNPIRIGARSAAEGSQTADTTRGYIVNQWHHFFAVWVTASYRYILFDGGNEGLSTGTATPVIDTPRITIGRLGDSSPSDPFSGMIAHIAIWNKALTRLDGRNLAAGLHPKMVCLNNLRAYWNWHEGSPEVSDGKQYGQYALVNTTSVTRPCPIKLYRTLPRPLLREGVTVAAAPVVPLSQIISNAVRHSYQH